ncbi:MAG: hypothetical protein R3B48_29815 [Kofleriaceae bacterium]
MLRISLELLHQRGTLALMPEFLLIMKRGGAATRDEDWATYLKELRGSPLFRGGSSLGNGVAIADKREGGACSVTGFMRFAAASRDEVRALVRGNPLYEAGGELELLELLED